MTSCWEVKCELLANLPQQNELQTNRNGLMMKNGLLCLRPIWNNALFMYTNARASNVKQPQLQELKLYLTHMQVE